MDKKFASSLLLNLIQRIDLGQISGFTELERDALSFAQRALGDGDQAAATSSPSPTSPDGPVAISALITLPETPSAPPPPLPKVALNLAAIERDRPGDPDVLLCLDFGTAMSKAFAFVPPMGYIDLALGRAAGGRGYPVPSSVC